MQAHLRPDGLQALAQEVGFSHPGLQTDARRSRAGPPWRCPSPPSARPKRRERLHAPSAGPGALVPWCTAPSADSRCRRWSYRRSASDRFPWSGNSASASRGRAAISILFRQVDELGLAEAPRRLGIGGVGPRHESMDAHLMTGEQIGTVEVAGVGKDVDLGKAQVSAGEVPSGVGSPPACRTPDFCRGSQIGQPRTLRCKLSVVTSFFSAANTGCKAMWPTAGMPRLFSEIWTWLICAMVAVSHR